MKSAFCLRDKQRINARLALREERAIRDVLIPLGLPMFLAFALADWLAVPGSSLLLWFLARLGVCVIALGVVFTTRGHFGYGTRQFMIYIPFCLYVSLFIVYHELFYAPYFAGFIMLVFSAGAIFPLPIRVAAPAYILCALPLFIYLSHETWHNYRPAMLALVMLIGGIIVSVAYGAMMRNEIVARMRAREQLAGHLINREREVREKTRELLKRKRFESQFSPQVIREVLEDMDKYDRLANERVCILVCDICDSTRRAQAIDPAAYGQVVERVFDIISIGCLRWDVTIDKFTGDGAQAFTGSPRPGPDGLERILFACGEIERLLNLWRDELEREWGIPPRMRYAVCEAEALVGFLGTSSLRSFTAIGRGVSLAHRLCAQSRPGAILVHSTLRPLSPDLFPAGFRPIDRRVLDRLKGFDEKQFETFELAPGDYLRAGKEPAPM